MTEKRLRLWQAQAFEEWKRSRFDAIEGYDDEQKWNLHTGQFDTTKTPRYKEVQGGTIAVVTGGGKTAVGFMAAFDWLRGGANRRVVIAVPTVRLLRQWREELIELGIRDVACMGGGFGRPVVTGRKVVVGVVNSLRKWSEGDHHAERLLIVDECHRLGSDGNSIIPQVIAHDAILGLSATPERSDGKSVTALTGPIIYRLSYREALDSNIIPSFTLKAVAAPLSWHERFEYDDYSQKIAIVHGKLTEEFGGSNFFGIPESASKYIAIFKALCNNRKRLVNNTRSRIDLLTHLLAKHAQDKVILFHESVSALNGLAHRFKDAYDPALYHYEIENREEEFQRWMDGDTKLLFSCRALNEGMNAPEVDVAIMLSGSNGVRSRIQTLGRALRGKNALIYLVYAPQTSDKDGLTGLISSGGVPKKFVKHFAWQDDTLTGITAPFWFSGLKDHKSRTRSDTPVEHRLFSREPLPLLDEAIGLPPMVTTAQFAPPQVAPPPVAPPYIPPYLGGGDTQ